MLVASFILLTSLASGQELFMHVTYPLENALVRCHSAAISLACFSSCMPLLHRSSGESEGMRFLHRSSEESEGTLDEGPASEQ